jgi:hypothetical protein
VWGRRSSRESGEPHSSVRILGVRVDALTYEGLLAAIGEFVVQGTPHQIATLNPEFVMAAHSNAAFRDVLEQADLCMADGVGLLWAARRQGHPLPERVTGSDGVPLIAGRAAQAGWGLYLLGAAPGVAERTARVLAERYTDLRITGTHAGSSVRGIRRAPTGSMDRTPQRGALCPRDDGGRRRFRSYCRRAQARPLLAATPESGVALSAGHSALALAAPTRAAKVRVGSAEPKN